MEHDLSELLKGPPKEKAELDKLILECDFMPDEKDYVDKIIKEKDESYSEIDYAAHIDFYKGKLTKLDRKFGDRIAVERHLKYLIGGTYELLATKVLGESDTEGGNYLERAATFEKAAFWYQSADECLGFLSDYGFRQAQSCLGAAYFRKKDGVADEKTKFLEARAGEIFNRLLSGFSKVTITSRLPEQIYNNLTEKKEGAITISKLRILDTPEHRN